MKKKCAPFCLLVVFLGCATPGAEKPGSEKAAAMGGCRHKSSGICIDAVHFAGSSTGCENEAIEMHLPAGCATERRFASCPLKEGTFIVRVYNQAQLTEVDNLCRDRGGRWAYD